MIINKSTMNLFLKQIILTSFLLSLSFVLSFYSKQLFINNRFIERCFFTNFLCFIPLLIMHLYSKKSLSFIGVFLLEIITFYINKRPSWNYNPFLSLMYAFCWGILPSFFLKKKENSFLKMYLSISFLFIIYFFLFYFLSLVWVSFVFLDKNSFLDLKNNFFSFRRLTIFIYIKFFSIFIISFIVTYLYSKVKKQILLLF